MKYIINFTILLLTLSISINLSAQSEKSTNIQPTIMAIPFTPEGQSLRANYEKDELLRIAITKVKEAFDERGVNTVDFRAKLKQVNNTEAMTEDHQSDIKNDVIALSGADIYVEVEANRNLSYSGNSVTVMMSAYDASSGESIANKVATSPKFNTKDFNKLTQKAVEVEVDNLLNTMQEKFMDIIENGRTATLNIGIAEGADFDLDTEVDDSGDLLSDILENWVYDNAYNNYYHVQGVTETSIIFDVVKLPLKDEKGRNYRISKFAAQLRNFLKDKGIDASRSVVGSSIIVTLN